MFSLPVVILFVLSGYSQAFVAPHAFQPQPWNEAPIVSQRATDLPSNNDPFYKPPLNYKKMPVGTILRHRKIKHKGAPVPIKAAYQLLYRSLNALGNPSATVTTIIIPKSPDLTKHIAYHIPYDTADEQCSPSYTLPQGGGLDSGIEQALLKGVVVSTSDYEGEEAAFAAGPQAAYGALDAIRAVISSGNITGISPQARTVMYGYSGGSIPTEWASEYQSTYAPELNIIGAAMGGLPVNTTSIALAISGTSAAGLVATAFNGLASAYPNLTDFFHHALIPSKAHYFHKPLHECSADFTNQDIFSYFLQGEAVLQNPVFKSVLEISGLMGFHGIPKNFPLYIFKGTADEIVPTIEQTDGLVTKFCENGATVKYVRYINGTHGSTESQGLIPALDFLFALLDGATVSKNCTTTNVSSNSGIF